jgi:hypothetical protein
VGVIYIYTALAFYGPFILLGAAVGYFFQRRLRIRKEDRRRDLIYSFLAIPPAANLLTLLFGIGEMSQWWYNSRFLIMLSPLLIMLLGVCLKGANTRFHKNKVIIVSMTIILLFVYPVIVAPLSNHVVAFIDAKNSMSYGTRPAATEIALHLRDVYKGGKVLMVTGSPQQNIIMQGSAIPLSVFYAANNIDTRNDVSPDTRYIILSKSPDPNLRSAGKIWHYGLERIDFPNNHFQQVFKNSNYQMFEHIRP